MILPDFGEQWKIANQNDLQKSCGLCGTFAGTLINKLWERSERWIMLSLKSEIGNGCIFVDNLQSARSSSVEIRRRMTYEYDPRIIQRAMRKPWSYAPPHITGRRSYDMVATNAVPEE